MKDIEIVLAALHAFIASGKAGADEVRARALFSDLSIAEQNASRDRTTAEFNRDGALVVLCR